LPAAMSPSAVQQALIPPAANFDIRDTDERLDAHGSHPNRTNKTTKTLINYATFVGLSGSF
jgi:hypothetical protein